MSMLLIFSQVYSISEIIGASLIGVLIWALVVFCFILISVYDVHLPTRKRRERKRFMKISYSILDHRVTNRYDLDRIYRNSYKHFYNSFDNFLSRFKEWSMLEHDLSDNGLSSDKLIIVTNFLSEILAKETPQDRYAGVPDDDKSALMQIDTLTDGIDDSKSKAIKQQLDTLCFSIKNNQKCLKRERRMNWIALFISLVGNVLSAISIYYQLFK